MDNLSKLKENAYKVGLFIFEIPVIGSVLDFILHSILMMMGFIFYFGSFPSSILVQIVARKAYRKMNSNDDEAKDGVEWLNCTLMFLFGIVFWIGIWTIADEFGIRIKEY